MRTALLCAALCTAACGARLSNVLSRSSASPSAALYECATQETERLGFDRRSHDKKDFRLVVARTDPEVRRAETTFRRGFDQLTIQVRGGSRDEGNAMEIRVQSFLEYFDRTGVRLVEREATSGALAMAETLFDRCATAPAGQDGAPAEGAGASR